ncbi:MAG TPA: signal peptidase II [Chloroflexota bacterium]
MTADESGLRSRLATVETAVPREQPVATEARVSWLEVALRLILWCGAAALVLWIDSTTKGAPHPIVLHHYRHVELLDLVPTALFLLWLGLYRAKTIALGAGLMFGGLLGNGSELIRSGYATDWILVGHYVTNVADIALVLGLLCLWINIALLWRRRRIVHSSRSWLRYAAGLTAAGCGLAVALATDDLRLGEVVFFLLLLEALVLERLVRRRVLT